MQLLSSTIQLSEALMNCPLAFIAEGQRTWHAFFACLYHTFGVDLQLLLVFCAGFWLFRSVAIQGLFRSYLGLASRGSDVDSFRKNVHLQHAKLTSDCDDPNIGPRLRCPAVRAQTGGQAPDFPSACTTVILRNIPKSYTPDALLASLHEGDYFGELDFIYVPIDFKHGDRSFGFAVLNFRRSSTCLQFASEFHMADACEIMVDAEMKLKPLEVSPSRVQGYQENIRRLQKSSVLVWLTRYPAWLPRVVDGGGLTMPLKAVRSRSRRRRPSSSQDAA